MTENQCAGAPIEEETVVNGGWSSLAVTIIGGLFLVMITAAGTAAYTFGQLSSEIRNMNRQLAEVREDIVDEHKEFRQRIRAIEVTNGNPRTR